MGGFSGERSVSSLRPCYSLMLCFLVELHEFFMNLGVNPLFDTQSANAFPQSVGGLFYFSGSRCCAGAFAFSHLLIFASLLVLWCHLKTVIVQSNVSVPLCFPPGLLRCPIELKYLIHSKLTTCAV